MSRTDSRTQLSNTITALDDAAKSYNEIQNDRTLPEAFHAAGKNLPVVLTVIKAAKSQLRDRATLPSGALKALRECKTKAQLLRTVFQEVAQAKEDRLDHYKSLIKQGGRKHLAETLVIGLMTETCTLAKDADIKQPPEANIETLKQKIDQLSQMDPSLSYDEDYTFAHFGSGDQFNATGGTQNNNTGGGNQFSGARFDGTVNFGSPK